MAKTCYYSGDYSFTVESLGHVQPWGQEQVKVIATLDNRTAFSSTITLGLARKHPTEAIYDAIDFASAGLSDASGEAEAYKRASLLKENRLCPAMGDMDDESYDAEPWHLTTSYVERWG